MVGPSLTDERRHVLNARLKAVVVLLVAGSGATVAFQSGASMTGVVLAFGLALLLGVALVWYLGRVGRAMLPSRR